MIKVVSSEEAEQADFVVCMREGEGDDRAFIDNVHGVCAECNHAIYFRPYSPKKPPHICLQCALARVEAGESGG